MRVVVGARKYLGMGFVYVPIHGISLVLSK